MSEKNDDDLLGAIAIPRQAGLYVRRVRERRGITRAQLAADAGVSPRLLASLELGDAPGIRLDKLLAVFAALGIELYAGCGEMGDAGQPRLEDNSPAPVGHISTSSPVYGALLVDIAHDQGISLVIDNAEGDS